MFSGLRHHFTSESGTSRFPQAVPVICSAKPDIWAPLLLGTKHMSLRSGRPFLQSGAKISAQFSVRKNGFPLLVKFASSAWRPLSRFVGSQLLVHAHQLALAAVVRASDELDDRGTPNNVSRELLDVAALLAWLKGNQELKGHPLAILRGLL